MRLEQGIKQGAFNPLQKQFINQGSPVGSILMLGNKGQHIIVTAHLMPFPTGQRIQEGMHWLPMTEDAVFEDGEAYLLRDKEDGGVVLGSWSQYPYGFSIKAERYIEDNRKQFTHYARITEPK